MIVIFELLWFIFQEISRLSERSLTDGSKILKDNYSLKEILGIKFKELLDACDELNDLCQMQNSLAFEKTCVDFTTYIEDKNNCVRNLCDGLREIPPFGK